MENANVGSQLNSINQSLMLPDLMPHCPSCRKVLKDHTSVARHMSQPQSGCNTWLDDIIKLNTIILPTNNHPMDTMDNNGLPMPYYEPGLRDEDNTYIFHGQEEDITLEVHDGIQDQGKDANSEVMDYFPNSPLTYEDGYTFLGLFNTDENSIYCKTNLYFPFSSQRDWQVAAWGRLTLSYRLTWLVSEL